MHCLAQHYWRHRIPPRGLNIQGAAFNVTHFDLAILLVWVVGGVTDNGGWVPCGLGFSEQWNVGPCSSTYFVWNSLC